MNLALGAVLLAILLMPALTFYYSYSSGSHAKATPKFTVPEYLLVSSTISVVLHGLVIHICKLNIHWELLLHILTGQVTTDLIFPVREKLSFYFYQFSIYIISINFGASTLGILSAKLVTSKFLRRHRLVQRLRGNKPPSNALRYFSTWRYYFRFYEYNSLYRSIIDHKPNAYLNILIETREKSILYHGTLYDWVAIGDTLDRIYLKKPRKEFFNKKESLENTQEGIRRDIASYHDGILCIPFSKVTNMYVSLISTSITFISDVPIEMTQKHLLQSILKIKPEDLPPLQDDDIHPV